MEKTDIVSLLKDCNINEIVSLTTENIEVNVFTPCASKFDPPFAVSSELMAAFGTMTPINGNFGLFGITARHCLVPEALVLSEDNAIEYVIMGYPQKSEVTQRSTKDSCVPIGCFTLACLGVDMDIGVSMLFPEHAHNINQVAPTIYARLESVEKSGDIISKKGRVVKVGISTFVTRGQIAEVTKDSSFTVKPLECSCFAAQGDSGALIISDEDDSRGIILGIVSQVERRIGAVLCVDISNLFDVELIREC